MSEEKLFKICVTAVGGQTFIWCKRGQEHVLPESLAITWIDKFKPHLFDILPSGEMVGADRDPKALKIEKVEKVPA